MSEILTTPPQVVIAEGYARYTDGFEFDMPRITTYLLEGGLDEERIAETTITFSDKPNPRHGRKNRTRTFGTYADNDIIIYALEAVFDMYVRPSQQNQMALTVATHGTLVHELEHRLADEDQIQKRKNNRYDMAYNVRHYSSWTAGAIGGAAALGYMSQEVHTPMEGICLGAGTLLVGMGSGLLLRSGFGEDTWYENHPEEKRCFAAETQVAKHFVDVRMKRSLVRPWMSPEDAEALRETYRHQFAEIHGIYPTPQPVLADSSVARTEQS